MKIVDQIRRLNRLIDLIRRKSTGSPKDLANRLEVSERTVYNMVDTLKELDIPVEYDECRGSYTFPDGIYVDFKIDIKQQEAKGVKGGNNLFHDFFGNYFSTAILLQQQS